MQINVENYILLDPKYPVCIISEFEVDKPVKFKAP